VKLIIQPDDGLSPILQAVKRARKSIDLVIFRFDRTDLEKAMAAAVTRGVVVRALIAHTNRGGEKILRKLELRLLEAGVTVARTADDLPRYHGKMAIIDDTVFILGFNYTRLDIEKSRSFGIVTRNKSIYKEAMSLYEADSTRQPYAPSHKSFVVSPEQSRVPLTGFIRGAKKQLVIYDEKITDRLLLRELTARADAGVEIRVLGKLGKMDKLPKGIEVRKLSDMRLHVRAIVRDGVQAFVGSQSLRKLELDSRRKIGLIVDDSRIAKKIQTVFESDWQHAAGKGNGKGEKDKDKEKDKEKEKDKNNAKVA
jgi:phosphatidylserine/phosphatidylglycerophosphate/cardiolipin synthase-like enzyme